ncbi:MAG: putative toxin-antitoxin system toxin component, PIN family [Sphingobacteriaceae bacterium]|nr:putative toxin-antitoxin system toxin component, PIN family [Cytophagaceae bacterium]
MKIVLDTNVLWVFISRKSKTHWVFQQLLEGGFTLCVTTDILEEYEEIIGQKLGEKTATAIMETLENLSNVQFITRYFQWNLIKAHPDDDKFTDCAIASNVDYLVTNDGHFNRLKTIPFPKINFLNSEEFKRLFDLAE